MKDLSIIEVSAGNFLRVQTMEYSSIEVTKDQIFPTGSLVVIDCKNPLISGYNKVKLVREVKDFDSIELVSGKKATYSIILWNENYRSE